MTSPHAFKRMVVATALVLGLVFAAGCSSGKDEASKVPVLVEGQSVTSSTRGTVPEQTCTSVPPEQSQVNNYSFCGPALAHIEVGSDVADLTGGSCQRGDTWFTANVGTLTIQDASGGAGGYITVSAGVFPDDFEVTTTTEPEPSTTALRGASGPIPDAAYVGTTTVPALPVTGDGVYKDQPVIGIRLGERTLVVTSPTIVLSGQRTALTFAGKAFDTGETVTGTIACIG